MMNLIDQPILGGILACAAFAGVQYGNLKIENDYRKEFEKDPVDLKLMAPQIVIGAIFLGLFLFQSRNRYVALTWPAFAGAVATLTCVWRVDRDLLLIPDRSQIIGAVSALLFLIVQIISGEPRGELFIHVGFGLALVALLWAMSVIYYRLRGQVGFGLGDVKLLAWMCVFLGQRTVDVIMLSIGIGLIQILISSFLSKRDEGFKLPKLTDAFAFGPAIILAFGIIQMMAVW
jgi:hypothetical protein